MKSSQRIRQTLARYQRKPVTQQGILGNAVGEIAVPNRTDYVYVRVAGLGTISIYNKRVPLILDLPVDIGYDPLEPKNFQVLNIHRYPQGGGRKLADVSTILHGKTHNWAGIDPVFIEKRQIMPLRPTPMGGMSIYVTREVTYYDNEAVRITGQQLDLSSYVPATGSWMVLLYKDTDELIKVSTGGVLRDIFSLSLDDAPQVYPGTVPIALVRLYGGQTGIAEGYQDTDLIDVRQLFSPIAATGSGGGGGGAFTDLSDTFSSYAGLAEDFIVVKADETGLQTRALTFLDSSSIDFYDVMGGGIGATVIPGGVKVEDLATLETGTSKRLAPDGAGGVEWSAGGGAVGDKILLYHEDQDPVSEYAFSMAGFATALSAAVSGDIILLPAGTIVDTSTPTYSVNAQISTGTIPILDGNGATVSGLTVGVLYAIEPTGGPWYYTGGTSKWCYKYRLSNGTTWSGHIGNSFQSRQEDVPSWSAFYEAIDANTYRVYFYAPATSIKIGIFDSIYVDNHGIWNWKLSSATKAGGTPFTIPAGVEVVGLGENSIIDCDIINNGGILTNLKITGQIFGAGTSRLVTNPSAATFSEQIKSAVAPGTSPFLIASETLVENLNSDLLDGMHATEIQAGSPGNLIFLNTNFT